MHGSDKAAERGMNYVIWAVQAASWGYDVQLVWLMMQLVSDWAIKSVIYYCDRHYRHFHHPPVEAYQSIPRFDGIELW